MQIVKDIYLAAGAVYGENANVYAINAGSEIILIDCGYDKNQVTTIKQSLRDWNLSDLPITHAFITHSHFDHTGNARYFEQNGVKLHASREDADAIMKGDDRTIGYAFMGRKFERCEDVTLLTDEEITQIGNIQIESFHVPGHTAGSMLFRVKMNEKYILFAGDFLIIKGTCEDAILGWNGGFDYDRTSYLESINRAKDIEADILLPGHGLVCMKNGSAILNMLYKEGLVHLR